MDCGHQEKKDTHLKDRERKDMYGIFNNVHIIPMPYFLKNFRQCQYGKVSWNKDPHWFMITPF
jgi:hypothetical protein